eukprot:s514_g15.t1
MRAFEMRKKLEPVRNGRLMALAAFQRFFWLGILGNEKWTSTQPDFFSKAPVARAFAPKLRCFKALAPKTLRHG